jgi:hypothetical protein
MATNQQVTQSGLQEGSRGMDLLECPGLNKGTAGELPAERVQAGHPAQRPRVDSAAGRGDPLVQRPLRPRHSAGREAHPRHLDNSLMLVTAANPHIGYEKSAQISLKAYREDLTLRDAALKLGFGAVRRMGTAGGHDAPARRTGGGPTSVSVIAARTRPVRDARRLLFASLVYLPVALAVMALDKLAP